LNFKASSFFCLNNDFEKKLNFFKDINDTSLRFDLTFKNTNINEINKCFNSTLGSSQMSSSSKLEVTFGGLSKEDAMAKVNGISHMVCFAMMLAKSMRRSMREKF